ncbi:energy transducer TonB [Winogradskyella sediminis]|uniref:energy transducer TonB n=1 Tax=Winogradskyella sediminis TaxID=1382466 RepID=UPI000E23D763|nr:energy transducer TonB [Winogradskyella sediminis]REG84101.1 TonB-like protein [Winogradskyella sediminis]
MNKITGIILTILLLISCKNSEKIETENSSEPEFESVELEFKRLGNKHTVDLEYLFLNENDEQIEFSSIQKMPEFPGGLDSLTKFVMKNYKFHQGNVEYLEGKVKTTFCVDTFGKVVDIEIIERLRKDYDTACYKVIAKLPDWKPAELNNGKKVKTKFLLPFKFVLEE